LTLSGATTLPDSTNDMPAAIDAGNQTVRISANADISGVTLTNVGGAFTIDNGVTASMTATQVNAFNQGGGINNNGNLDVTASGNISALDLTGVSNLTLSANTTMSSSQTNAFSGQVVKGNSAITVNISGDVSSQDITIADTVNVADGSSVQTTIEQHNSINSGLGGSETVTLSDAGTISANSNVEIYQLADGVNTFTSSSSNHTILGGSGDDTIVGGSGIDTITAGAGVDTLTGNGGADKFKFSTTDTGINSLSEADSITDFQTASDEIVLVGVTNVGNVSISNWTTALSLENLTSEANNAFDGNGVDILVKVSNFIGATVAIDMNESGSFDSGDLLLQLDNVTSLSDLNANDFVI